MRPSSAAWRRETYRDWLSGASEYIETLVVNDLNQFWADGGTDTMKKVHGEFQQFAESPLVILTDEIKG
jgi:hypothetical protein